MRNIFYMLVGMLLTHLSVAQTKRALIIAISQYPTETGWPPISAQNDVPLIVNPLKQQGFMDIVVLQDEKATRACIVDSLKSLIKRSRKGDKIVIHFSTHGQQIVDNDNDEADGRDEAIVGYGAPLDTKGRYATYTGDQHLRDEDLGRLIDELRQQLGSDGDVLLLADACHSGTITRGNTARLRGTTKVLQLKMYRSTRTKQRHHAFLYRKPISQTGLAPYVAISAADAHEANSESWVGDKEVGSLSYAFNQAIQQARPGESYRALFARIQSTMKEKVPGQTPQMEGDVDRALFGGRVVPQEDYLAVRDIKENRTKLELGTGHLGGLFDSTRIVVCSRGTITPKSTNILATGLVVRSDLYSSTIQLNKALTGYNTADYWIFVTERSSGDLMVTVLLDSLTNQNTRQQVQTELKRNKLVRFSGAPDLYLKQEGPSGSLLRFYRADGTPLDTPVPVSTPRGLSKQLQRYAQGQFLAHFNFNGNASVQFTAQLVPLQAGATSVTQVVTNDSSFYTGPLLGFVAEKDKSEENKKDKAALVIRNTGSVVVYYTVLDIMPNGDVGVIFPNPDDPKDLAENYRVAPGDTQVAHQYIRFTPPYGKETFKVLVTTEPVDLRNVVGKSRGSATTRGSMKLLERMYDDTNDMAALGMGTRGGSSQSFPEDGNIATQNIVFEIITERPVNSSSK